MEFGASPALIPLKSPPDEAHQFNTSPEDVEIAGKPMRVSSSRSAHVRGNARDTQEKVFDAHARRFAFCSSVPLRRHGKSGMAGSVLASRTAPQASSDQTLKMPNQSRLEATIGSVNRAQPGALASST